MAPPAHLGRVFTVALLLFACGGTSPEESRPEGEGPEPASSCGNLDQACSASEYCRVSSVLKSDGESLVLTSECEPLPSPSCPATQTQEALCACLSADAVSRGGNCALSGTTFSCEVQGRGGTSTRWVLNCLVRP